MCSSQSPGFRSSGTIFVSPADSAKVRPGEPISGRRKNEAPMPMVDSRVKSVRRGNMWCPPGGTDSVGGAGSNFRLDRCFGPSALRACQGQSGRMINQRLVAVLRRTFAGATVWVTTWDEDRQRRKLDGNGVAYCGRLRSQDA